jgi:hypothetical protein
VIFAFLVGVCECVHIVGGCAVARLQLYYIYNINNKDKRRRQGSETHTYALAHTIAGGPRW